MNFDWLKRMMPRGLYGRAVMILFLPVVVVTLVVTVMFLQRHFEDVTRQMTAGLSPELVLIDSLISEAPDADTARAEAAAIAAPLGLVLSLPGGAELEDERGYFDFSGRVVISSLHALVPPIRAVSLANGKDVVVALDGRYGPYEVSFSRRRVSASNPHQLLVLMAGTSILMSVIATLFLRNQLRPIKRLASVADAYGKGRILPYRPGGAIEVRKAGQAFLEMRSRIERQNDQRGQMLSGISHDLRTPLTRLKLGLSMLTPDLPPEPEEIAALESDVAAMAVMVDAFLDHARSVAQEPEPVQVVASDFLRRIVADAQRGGQAVEFGTFEGNPEELVMLRTEGLRRAIENLIGNAVRYGSRAVVDAVLAPNFLRISIEDDGPGIAPERRDEAMRPFTRLDPSRNQNKGEGVGLGLSIAADVARSHGGQLRLGAGQKLGGLLAEIVLPR